MLEQELAPLEARIEQARQRKEALEGELRAVEAELETFSAERQRIDALRDVCNALDKLGELKADELVWEGVEEAQDAAGRVERARSRVARFEAEIGGILENQASLQGQIKQCLDELDFLYEEVRDAYDREERRKEEFVIEREISPVPYRAMVMPWTKETEDERYFRRAVLVALFIGFLFGAFIPLIKVPIPDRSVAVAEIPKRLVQLVKKEIPKPAPAPKRKPKQVEEETEQAKKKPKPQADEKKPDEPPKKAKPAEEPTKMAAGDGGASAGRNKAEGVGVLKFKNAFKDLMKEVPVARLGTEARLSNESLRMKGQAVAQRSLVAMQAVGGSSGGIGGAGVSRNVGYGNAGRLGGGGSGYGIGSGAGGGGFVRVESSIADLEESSRPTNDGLAAGRTDEEIQIVFDRYKAALYRIYNQELRKDPTLRGEILMRISIEPDGAVSLCKVESTDLASPELVAKIAERIRRFNFGPKEGVQKVTILYPIDFLPSGERNEGVRTGFKISDNSIVRS